MFIAADYIERSIEITEPTQILPEIKGVFPPNGWVLESGSHSIAALPLSTQGLPSPWKAHNDVPSKLAQHHDQPIGGCQPW